jgi:hypothetical protein
VTIRGNRLKQQTAKPSALGYWLIGALLAMGKTGRKHYRVVTLAPELDAKHLELLHRAVPAARAA